MRETSKTTYDFGKLKRFLTVIRLMMQDTIASVIQKSYKKYEEFIYENLPVQVNIKSSSEVENVYESDLRNPNEKQKKHIPLFQIDLLKTSMDDEFIYSSKNPKVYVGVVLHAFDKALDELSKVPDLEPKILADLYKSQKLETFIKSPVKPVIEPVDPKPSDRPRKYPDENKWLWVMYQNIEKRVQNSIDPLSDYLKAWEPYMPILKSIPEDVVKEIENMDPPMEIDGIQEEVYKILEKKKNLAKLIPQTIHVSCFEIKCSETHGYLQEKLDETIKWLTNLIAKRAQEGTHALFLEFQNIKKKIGEEPDNIEKLTEMKEYMQDLPNLL